jgi:hypothetical protein
MQREGERERERKSFLYAGQFAVLLDPMAAAADAPEGLGPRQLRESARGLSGSGKYWLRPARCRIPDSWVCHVGPRQDHEGRLG